MPCFWFACWRRRRFVRLSTQQLCSLVRMVVTRAFCWILHPAAILLPVRLAVTRALVPVFTRRWPCFGWLGCWPLFVSIVMVTLEAIELQRAVTDASCKATLASMTFSRVEILVFNALAVFHRHYSRPPTAGAPSPFPNGRQNKSLK